MIAVRLKREAGENPAQPPLLYMLSVFNHWETGKVFIRFRHESGDLPDRTARLFRWEVGPETNASFCSLPTHELMINL